MPRLADQQAKIRQQAEALALQLRRYHLSGGELETSVNAMNRVEQAIRKEDGLAVRRAFSQALSALGAARDTVDSQVSVRREQDKLPPWVREQMRVGVQDGVPKGYEEMVAEYYRALAEGRSQ
jgi:ABC-type transporter Mla subunit MlaD